MFLHELAQKQITDLAVNQGFHSVRFVQASDAVGYPKLCEWLDRGFAASMSYIEKRKEAYRNPNSVLPDCKSLILLTLPYQGHAWTSSVTKRSRRREIAGRLESTIGSYAAVKEDYHHWIRRQLKPIASEIQRMFPTCKTRAVVDTAPLLERDYAHQAGVGWIGKNTMLLSRQLGSYFFLCAILTQAALAEHSPNQFFSNKSDNAPEVATSHCGTCRACLDACPTQAFVEPYVLDANRCISYWTIEHRGAIPEQIRPDIGPWLFGCDVCQIVCPWNTKVRVQIPPDMRPESLEQKSDCLHWLSIDETQFESLYGNTPFSRTGLLGMQRNALIVAANLGIRQALPHIRQLTTHSSQEIRLLATWALSKFE